MITVRFYTLTNPFRELRREDFETMAEARRAVEAHAASGGFRNVRDVPDPDSWRFTATSPGGRAGRNIAYIDYDEIHNAY